MTLKPLKESVSFVVGVAWSPQNSRIRVTAIETWPALRSMNGFSSGAVSTR